MTWLRRLSIAAAVIAVPVFAAAWHFSGVLLHPAPSVCPDFYFYCDNPRATGLPLQDVSYETNDGLTIRGWYVERDPRAPGILLVHGHNASRYEGLRYAPSLYKAGFNLLLIDLRNCGESDASFISMGYYERRDVAGGIDYLLRTKGLPSVGIFGFSMGAATSTLAMAEDPRIKAGVLDSGFTSFYDIIRDRGRQDFGVPEYPLIPIVQWLFELRGGINADELRPIDVIARISPRPVFLLHGTADRIVPFAHGEDLYRASAEPKFFWPVAGADHVRGWNTDRDYAESEIPGFFQTHLLGRRTIPELEPDQELEIEDIDEQTVDSELDESNVEE